MNNQLRLLLETVDYQITSGSDFLWSCFPNSWMMDFRDKSGSEGSVVVSGAVTYQVNVCDNETDEKFVWTNPDYREAYFEEGRKREIDLSDERVVEDFSDILQKIRPMSDLDLDLDDETFRSLAMAAHKANMTLNQFIQITLALAVEEAMAAKEAEAAEETTNDSSAPP